MEHEVKKKTFRACALIPARGGSKRIPRKNIVDFCGEPLIVSTIRAAQESEIFEKVIVSTEDEEIKKVATPYCLVDDRNPELASDNATLKDVCLEFIGRHPEFDVICLMEADCPLRTADDLKASWRAFSSCGKSMLMSVFRYGTFYPFWALSDKDEDGNQKEGFQLFFSQKYLKKSQQLPTVYCPSGAFKWIDVKRFLVSGTLYPEDLDVYELDWKRALDIDTIDDLLTGKMLKVFMQEHPPFFEKERKKFGTPTNGK